MAKVTENQKKATPRRGRKVNPNALRILSKKVCGKVIARRAAGKRSGVGLGYTVLQGMIDDGVRRIRFGKDGEEKAVRKFHRNAAQLENIFAEAKKAKRLPNPQDRGAYWAIVHALGQLGAGTLHPFDKVYAAIEQAMKSRKVKSGQTFWQTFVARATASFGKMSKTSKSQQGISSIRDLMHRNMRHNIQVLQRINMISETPYGVPLKQCGLGIVGCDDGEQFWFGIIDYQDSKKVVTGQFTPDTLPKNLLTDVIKKAYPEWFQSKVTKPKTVEKKDESTKKKDESTELAELAAV